MASLTLEAATERKWLVRWMYASAIAHLLVGLALPWVGHIAALDWYHLDVARSFWPEGAPAAARAQQAWWIGLFGPTLQSIGIWMLALTWFGDKRQEAAAWLWLAAAVLLWGPQDIMVSLRAGVWPNVWVDLFAMATLLPPALRLYWLARRAAT